MLISVVMASKDRRIPRIGREKLVSRVAGNQHSAMLPLFSSENGE